MRKIYVRLWKVWCFSIGTFLLGLVSMFGSVSGVFAGVGLILFGFIIAGVNTVIFRIELQKS